MNYQNKTKTAENIHPSDALSEMASPNVSRKKPIMDEIVKCQDNLYLGTVVLPCNIYVCFVTASKGYVIYHL